MSVRCFVLPVMKRGRVEEYTRLRRAEMLREEYENERHTPETRPSSIINPVFLVSIGVIPLTSRGVRFFTA